MSNISTSSITKESILLILQELVNNIENNSIIIQRIYCDEQSSLSFFELAYKKELSTKKSRGINTIEQQHQSDSELPIAKKQRRTRKKKEKSI